MSKAECDDRLRADGEKSREEPSEPEPPNPDGERDGSLPGALVPPPFGENEPPFTD